jgi:hypothetical protein
VDDEPATASEAKVAPAEDQRSAIARALNPAPRSPVEARGEYFAGRVVSAEHRNRAQSGFDARLDATEVRQEIKARLTQHQVGGNAAKLEGFVADGPVQDHAELARKMIRALQDRDLLRSADIRMLTPLGDGTTVEVTIRAGEKILLRFTVGKVADGHPAAYRLTGGTEYAVVTVSDRIRDEDLARAIAHEVRELSTADVRGGLHTTRGRADGGAAVPRSGTPDAGVPRRA